MDFSLDSLVGLCNSHVCVGFELKRTWLLLLSCITLGLTSFSIQFSASRPAELEKSVQSFGKVNAEFKVLDEPIQFSTGVNYWVNIRLLNAQIGDRKLGFAARGQLRGGNEIGNLQRGGIYRCQLSLSPTPMGERAGFKARCGKALELVESPEPASRLILVLRSAFLNNLNGVNSDSSGLVAGLAIGDVSRISPELQREMKLVSLTHLTAVSGANCAIVLAMFYFVVRRLGGGRWVRLAVGIGALCGYVLLVGAQPSVLRAAVMAGAVLIGISLGRKSTPMNALALSVVVLLVADPWLAVDFGFALSVAATLGLLVLTQPIAVKLGKRIPKPLAIAMAVVIAAQIFCLPILLQLQSGLATYSLPANILASPLVAPITILGILACLVAWVLPGLAGALTYLASCFAWLITQLVHGFANASNATLSWPTGV
ncbi:MAG: hypothetical protein RL570_812, partial [Actinomycetota bacterium]